MINLKNCHNIQAYTKFILFPLSDIHSSCLHFPQKKAGALSLKNKITHLCIISNLLVNLYI